MKCETERVWVSFSFKNFERLDRRRLCLSDKRSELLISRVTRHAEHWSSGVVIPCSKPQRKNTRDAELPLRKHYWHKFFQMLLLLAESELVQSYSMVWWEGGEVILRIELLSRLTSTCFFLESGMVLEIDRRTLKLKHRHNLLHAERRLS